MGRVSPRHRAKPSRGRNRLERVRKTSAALATLSLAVLALTGCTAAPTFNGASCDRTASASGIGEAVTVEGEVGEAPEVEVFSPVHVKKTSFTDVATGDGRALVSAQQALNLELSIYSGETGKQVFATPYDSNAAAPALTINEWAERSPGLGDVLQCATAGTRILAALTADDFGPANIEGLGLAADDTAIFVIDVLDAFLPKAEGTLQFNDARGLPTVVRASDGTPGIIIPDSAAPEKQTVQTLIKGEGEVLTAEQTPLVNFTAIGWDDKQILQTTWGDKPSAQLAAPVADALVGQPVGSQVMVVLPATDGSPAIAVVVDVLGVTSAPTQ